MIAQDSGRGLDGHILQALRVEQATRHLGARDPVLGAELSIFGDVHFDARLRKQSQQQAGKHKYPEKRILEHGLTLTP